MKVWVQHRIKVEELLLCTQFVTNETGPQTFFFLYWTFRAPTVKEINLFLQAHVSLSFLSPAPSSFPLYDPVSPFFSVSVDGALSRLPPPPLVSPFPHIFSLHKKGRFRGHQLRREGWESCMGSALGAAILYYHQGDCRYAAATGCWHNHSLGPSTRLHGLS